MPSSEKTSNLQLNRWLGEDKPKREDFNSDNARVDSAWREVREAGESAAGRCAALEAGQEGLRSRCGALEESAGKLEEEIGGVKGEAGDLRQSMNVHLGNGEIHVTAEEKAAWSAAAPLVGMYMGDGSGEQRVIVGFKPRNGYFFPVGKATAQYSPTTETLQVYNGFMSSWGCSQGVELHDRGFTVSHSISAGVGGISLRYNEEGLMYAYFLWR